MSELDHQQLTLATLQRCGERCVFLPLSYHESTSSSQNIDSHVSQEREIRTCMRRNESTMTACCFCCYTALVVLTALLGYSMAPAPLEWTTLTWAMMGTTLCSAAANTGNQVTFNPLIFVTISLYTHTHIHTLSSRGKARVKSRTLSSEIRNHG